MAERRDQGKLDVSAHSPPCVRFIIYPLSANLGDNAQWIASIDFY